MTICADSHLPDVSRWRVAAVVSLLPVLLAHAPLCSTVARGEGPADRARHVRHRVELNGTWQFRMDPKEEGLPQRWFAASVEYPDKIEVPGCWQAQGFGPARGHLRHDYQGKAWYRRTIAVPAAWNGKRIYLHVGAASNTAEVYVNGTKVGCVEGYLTPYEFDVTGAVKPGEENTMVCLVDSGGVAPLGMFNFVGRWGGLNREVFLEARSDPAIEDVFVMPDVRNRTARTQVVLRRHDAGEAWRGDLEIRIAPISGGAVSQGHRAVRFAAGKRHSEPVTIDVLVRDMHRWSPEDPFLYSVWATLSSDGSVLDAVCDRFGMRQFEVGPGGELLLNGRPYFVRGLGDDSVEVMTGIQYPDKQIYVERLKRMKRYGFNGIRFLSHTPIREYFEAADEVGVLLLCDGEIYRKPKEAIPLLKKQVSRIAKAYRNHPSWYAWSSGNELFECQGADPDPEWTAYVRYAHDTFKKLDSTRLFIGSEGADVFPTDVITQAGKFGGPPPGVDQPFDGLVDEVAYFKRALTGDEMAQAANRSAGDYVRVIQSLEPSGYWRFEDTTPPRAADASGNGLDGVYDTTMTAEEMQQPGVIAADEPGSAVRIDADHKGVHLKDVAAQVFARGNQPFSISLWVKPNAFRRGDFGTPFAYGAARNGAALLVATDGVAGTGKLRLGRFYDDFLVSNGALAARCWNHVGITHDGAVLTVYLNGRKDSSSKVELAVHPLDGRIGASVQKPSQDEEDLNALRKEYASRPHIWHEFPNTYVGPLPDLTIMDRWTGVFRDDRCISHHRRQIADLELSERYPVIRRRSVDHFYLYLKSQFELARHSATMDGYGYWCFTDFPGGPEGDMTTYGIFSTVYEPEKFPDPAPILEFNRETVLLNHTDVAQRVLASGEERPVTLSISHFGREPIREGQVSWEVKAQSDVLQRGTIDSVRLQVGDVIPIGTVTLGPFETEQAMQVRLSVRLKSEACRQRNHWDYWVFPDRLGSLKGVQLANLSGAAELDERYGTDSIVSPELARLIVTNRLTGETLQQLDAGKSVLLLAEDGALARPRPLSFWPLWIRSTGTFVEDHPALEEFPHQGYCACQFIRLFDGLKTIDLTEKGSTEREKLTPIVWGLTQDYDPAGPESWASPDNRWKIFRHGIVCEGRVAGGKLLVCCLGVLRGIRERRPEAGWLMDNLVAYALSKRFAPSTPVMTTTEAGKVFRLTSDPSQ